MRINHILENTTAGSVATVAQPMMTQTRGLKPASQIMKGVKKKGPYANSIVEGKVKELTQDLKDLTPHQFQEKYKQSKAEIRADMKKVNEDDLSEQDLIVIPGQGRLRKSGFTKHDPDRAEHEGQTLKNSLHTIIRVATHLDRELSTKDNFPEWVSEKIGATKSMIVSVMDYLISSKEMQSGTDAMESAMSDLDADRKEKQYKGTQDYHAKKKAEKQQSGGSTVEKCAALAAKYFNSAGLQSSMDIDEYIKQEMAKQGVAEGAPELLKKEMPLHRHAEKLLAQNGVSKDDPDYHHHLGNTIKHLRQFGNIDLINKQGVAEGLPQTLRKIVPGYAKREIDKKMDAGKFGKTDADKDANFQRYKKIQDKIKEQGVAEGIDTEELANEVYAEFERIYPNLARRADERTVHAAIMDVLNYGGDSNPSALAQDVARAVKQEMQQGVAEGLGGNWYIRVNGKILNDTKFKPVIFSSEDEARSHAMKLADKKRIPLSQIKLTKSWMDAPEQGVAEGSQEINWVKPNFDFEWHEVEEQSRMKQVPVDVRQYYQKHFPNKDAWLKAVQNGKAVAVPPDHAYEIRNAPFDKASLQKVLAPTGHEGPIGPAKEKRVNDLFDKGQVEMPIILKTSQGLWLIGGKTRLGTANYVKGLPAKVWLISGEQGVAEGKTIASGLNDWQKKALKHDTYEKYVSHCNRYDYPHMDKRAWQRYKNAFDNMGTQGVAEDSGDHLADLSKIKTAKLQQLHALHSHYGQTDPRSKSAAQRTAAELKRRGISSDRQGVEEGSKKEDEYGDDYQDMVSRVGQKAKQAQELKNKGKEPQTRWNPVTKKYYVDFSGADTVKESAILQGLHKV